MLKPILLAALTTISISAMAATNELGCRVTAVQGNFHSERPPQVGDTITLSLQGPGLGSDQKILFGRTGSSVENAPYVFGFLGRNAPEGTEKARFGISWIRRDGHLIATLTVDYDLTAKFSHRWSSIGGAVEESAMDLKCEPLATRG